MIGKLLRGGFMSAIYAYLYIPIAGRMAAGDPAGENHR